MDVRLKGSGRVGQSERHYKILEMAVLDPKRSLLFISSLDSDLVIGISEVNLREYLSID
jgi:hypothetical protein